MCTEWRRVSRQGAFVVEGLKDLKGWWPLSRERGMWESKNQITKVTLKETTRIQLLGEITWTKVATVAERRRNWCRWGRGVSQGHITDAWAVSFGTVQLTNWPSLAKKTVHYLLNETSLDHSTWRGEMVVCRNVVMSIKYTQLKIVKGPRGCLWELI